MLKPTFVRIFISLVDILLKKVQFPVEEQFNDWSMGMLIMMVWKGINNSV